MEIAVIAKNGIVVNYDENRSCTREIVITYPIMILFKDDCFCVRINENLGASSIRTIRESEQWMSR